jgi:hypothetical protein
MTRRLFILMLRFLLLTCCLEDSGLMVGDDDLRSTAVMDLAICVSRRFLSIARCFYDWSFRSCVICIHQQTEKEVLRNAMTDASEKYASRTKAVVGWSSLSALNRVVAAFTTAAIIRASFTVGESKSLSNHITATSFDSSSRSESKNLRRI